MVGIPSRTLLRTEDVGDQSQLATEERSSLAHATSMAIHGAMMAVQAERARPPTAPTDPELRWLDDDVIRLLDPQTLAEYAITARDAYFWLHQRCSPRPTGQEPTFMEVLFANDASVGGPAHVPTGNVDEIVQDKGKGPA